MTRHKKERTWKQHRWHDVESEQKILWYNKQKYNVDVATQALMIMDVVKMVAQNIGNDGEGMQRTHADCKVAWEMMTVDRFKSI